jgi:hypothetical protein
LFADIIYFGILFGGRNPLYVGGVFAVFLLIKALWVQLDISGEFRNGAVSFKPVSFLVPLPRTSYFQQIPLTLETSILTETTKLFKLAFKISCLFKLLVSVLSKLVVDMFTASRASFFIYEVPSHYYESYQKTSRGAETHDYRSSEKPCSSIKIFSEWIQLF